MTIFFFHIQTNTERDGIPSYRDHRLDVLMTPEGFAAHVIVQPPHRLHLLASLALFGVIDDKGEGLSFLWTEHFEHLIGFQRKRLPGIPSPHVEKVFETGAMGKRGGIQVTVQSLDVSSLPAHCNNEYQDLEVVEMPVAKLAFQRAEKTVEFGGERDDLKHERQPPMGLVWLTFFIGWFAFFICVFLPSIVKSQST